MYNFVYLSILELLSDINSFNVNALLKNIYNQYNKSSFDFNFYFK